MKKAELVFIPASAVGHLVSTVQVAKLLVDRDERLSITILILKQRSDSKIDSYIDSVSTDCNLIRFIHLPKHQPDPNQPSKPFFSWIETQKHEVKEEVSKLVSQSELSPDSPKVAGFVLDMSCTSMIDVANEFGIPSYIFFTTGAALLGLVFYIQVLHDEQKVDATEFKASDAELVVPYLANPVPAKVLPATFFDKDRLPFLLCLARRFRETKGIMVNTFEELESYAVNSFSHGNTPPVYPVGPILNLNREGDHDLGSDKREDIEQWLDDQPQSSVVYLCFGSVGSFDMNQVKEIACALEQSGHRFLWSLRQPSPQGDLVATDYVNLQKVLPEGFLDRTIEIGKVIGWAPQVDILSHSAVGGFVSHCGWNSILESIWFGVPIAAWPMRSEQQFNAFQMIIELGLGVEIKMDYRKEHFETNVYEDFITSKEIERGIKSLMRLDGKKRKKLEEMSEKSRKALMNDGSSYTYLGRLIQDMVNSMP